VDGLSCASASQCVFFAANGQVGVTNKPTTTSTSDWPALVVDAYNKLESVSCPSATVCVAGGTQKTVYTSANPTGGAGAWSTTALPIASDRVSCGATNQCVVGDGIAGDLAATSTPLSGGWIEAQTSGDLPDGGGIAVLSCTDGPFCIAGPYEVQSDSDDEGDHGADHHQPDRRHRRLELQHHVHRGRDQRWSQGCQGRPAVAHLRLADPVRRR
jgi:hypothetical protein